MIKNKIASLIYKTILITISFLVMYEYILGFNGDTFTYFTILSNILVFAVFAIVWVKTLKDVIIKKEYVGSNEHLLMAKCTATLAITVTFLVFAFMLADYGSKSNYSVHNLAEHYIIPVMVIVDYFLFDKKGTIKLYHPLIWVGCVLIYVPYIFIRAAILGPNTELVRYPYFFLNLDDLGVGGVALWCVGLLVFFTILAYLIYLFDRFNGKKNKSLDN